MRCFRVLSVAAGFFLAVSSTLQAVPTYTTGTYFGGSGTDRCSGVKFANDGTLIVVGNTDSSGAISGKTAKVIGSDPSTVSSTGFVLRYSNDGRTLLSYTRFAWGMCQIDGVNVDSTGIYVVGFATSAYANLISGLGGLDRTGPASGKKPFIAKLSLDGQTLIDGTYLAGFDSSRDELKIDFLSGGDVVVIHDNGDADYLSRLSNDLGTQRWRTTFGTRAGSCRALGLAAAPNRNKIYVTGFGQGNTCCEPLKGTFSYQFDGTTGAREWIKSNGNAGIYNWAPKEGDGRLNGLISDSTGEEVAVDANGYPLFTAYSDGGATIHTKDPNDWLLDENNIDGDWTFHFGGATRISVYGRFDPVNQKWIRINTLIPVLSSGSIGQAEGTAIFGIAAMAHDRVVCVGAGGLNWVGIKNWYTSSNAKNEGIILKSKMDSSGTVREFSTRIPWVRHFNHVARDRNTTRYAAVGMSIWAGAPTPGGIQTAFGGGAEDGFMVVFDDSNVPPTVNIANPAPGTALSAPGNLTLTANAADSDGTVSKVDFYSDLLLIGTDSTSPYSVQWNQVPTGTYKLTATVTDNGGETITSSPVDVAINCGTGFCARVNFQPSTASVPANYLPDSGASYGARGNGHTYGWNISNSNVHIVNKYFTDARYMDQRYDTLAYMQRNGTNYTWEIAVPNGSYNVRIVAGHPEQFWNSVYKINAEGTLVVDGTPNLLKRWIDGFATVSVTDGRLTISNATGSTLNRICFIHVSAVGASNVPPTVQLTSPASGSTYMAPASIGMSATASDSDGSVSKVDFLSGSTLLGTDISSPYALTWASVPAGAYSLSAKATDNAGATGVSSSVSVTVNSSSSTTPPPTGTLTATKTAQPSSLSLSTEGSSDWSHWGLNASTDWNHRSGITAQISNITKVGTGTVNRYTDGTMTVSWSGGTPTASSSGTRTGLYVAGVGSGFQITAPADTAERTLKVYCGVWKSQGRLEATLSDGSAAAIVDTSHGSTTGSANTAFTINYKAGSSSQTLTVRWSVAASHDTAGAGTVGWQAATLSSGGVVDPCAGNSAPTASITSPASGATYTAPASVTINANAADSNGTISKVDFYNGTSLIGTDNTSPYSFIWGSVPAGSYSLNAKATDNCGAVGSSAAVSVTVNSSSAPAGSLSATKAAQPATLALHAEGTRDWSHWGLNASTDWNHKSGITAQISNITKVGVGTISRYTDGTMANSWTGGTPTGSVTSTKAGIYVAGVNNGFQITVPADTTARTLKVYCGVWKSQGKLEATLSDNSAAALVDTSHGSTTGSVNTVFSVNYKAASAGQTLTLRWTVQTSHDTAGGGTVGWQAATLQ